MIMLPGPNGRVVDVNWLASQPGSDPPPHTSSDNSLHKFVVVSSNRSNGANIEIPELAPRVELIRAARVRFEIDRIEQGRVGLPNRTRANRTEPNRTLGEHEPRRTVTPNVRFAWMFGSPEFEPNRTG